MLLPRLARRALARTSRTAPPSGPAPRPSRRPGSSDAVLISCPEPTAEDHARKGHQERGQFLARQDRWADLAGEMRRADAARHATSGGMPVADLLGLGARADVVRAVEHMLLDGPPATDAPLHSGIDALEEVLADTGPDMILVTLIAQTHLDIAQIWRRSGSPRTAIITHLNRARALLAPYDTARIASPLLIAATAALLAVTPASHDRALLEYQRLIDLDPSNPGPMRALGHDLGPHDAGRLGREARRMADRTRHIWGAGGYVWMMFDTLPRDNTACAQLDLALFIDGLHDILNRGAQQHTVNLLAAYCAQSCRPPANDDGPAGRTRSQIAACADWIVRGYMTELHPLIWARAARPPLGAGRMPSARGLAAEGRADGLRTLAGLFHPEITRGDRIVFTANGPVAEPA